ncbi:MAG: patatin-like phospholipase family protein, partial [Nocardioidaceae bacterium]
MQDTTTPQSSSARVALVLDAGGARSAYQVGALEVLLPALAEHGARPRVLIGTSAGALLSGVLAATAHLEADEQVARLRDVLGQATKRHVLRPLWRQVPDVLARYASETLGLSAFRLRGLFGTQPLARTLARSIDWEALHRNVEEGFVETAAVTATSVRTGQVMMFTESTAPLPPPVPD